MVIFSKVVFKGLESLIPQSASSASISVPQQTCPAMFSLLSLCSLFIAEVLHPDSCSYCQTTMLFVFNRTGSSDICQFYTIDLCPHNRQVLWFECASHERHRCQCCYNTPVPCSDSTSFKKLLCLRVCLQLKRRLQKYGRKRRKRTWMAER